MADKIVLNKALGTYDVAQINNNFAKLQDELNENVLYRKNPAGTTNTMKSSLDMNGFHIFNLPAPASDNEPARLKDVANAVAGLAGQTANLVSFAPTPYITATNVQGAIQKVMDRAMVEVNVIDYGADPTGTLDSSAAIRSAIDAARTKAGNTQASMDRAKTAVVKFPPGFYKVDTKVLVPMNTTLRGDGATILCNNAGSTFESGYYVGGVLTSNVSLSFDATVANVLSGVRFEGLTFYGGDRAINMAGCVWQSGVFDCSFYKCHIAIDARLSFYATYQNITIRGENDAFAPAQAIRLFSNTNRVLIDNVSITDRKRGFLIGEPGDANLSGQIQMSNCSFEVMDYGVEFSGQIRNFHAHDIYIEEVSNVFCDADGDKKYNFNIHDVYIYSAAYYIDMSGVLDSFIGRVRDWTTSEFKDQKSIIRLRAGTYGNKGTRVERAKAGELTDGNMTTRYQLSDGVLTDGWLVARQVDANGNPTTVDHVVLNQRYEHNISQSQFNQQVPIYDRGFYGVSLGKVVGVVSGNMNAVTGTQPYFVTNFPYSEYTALNYAIKIIPNAGSGVGGTTPAPIWVKGIVIGGHATQIVPNGFTALTYKYAATGTFQLAFDGFGTTNTDPAFAWMRNGLFTCEGIVKVIA